TPGFRADMERAQAVAVEGYGYDSRHMAVVQNNGVNLAAGPLMATGRELDFAVKGTGLIVLPGGEGEAYTRPGRLQAGSERRPPPGGGGRGLWLRPPAHGGGAEQRRQPGSRPTDGYRPRAGLRRQGHRPDRAAGRRGRGLYPSGQHADRLRRAADPQWSRRHG